MASLLHTKAETALQQDVLQTFYTPGTVAAARDISPAPNELLDYRLIAKGTPLGF